MACLEMYNNSQASPPSMSPRISFSNEFVESQNNNNNFISKRTELPLPTSDFEFSVSNINRLTSADELFFKGRLLPFKNNNNNGSQIQRTLRDELLVNDDDNDGGGEGNIDFSLKPPKGSSTTNKWKGFLGLRKSHIGSKKVEKVDVFSFDSGKRFSFSIQDPNLAKSSKEMVSSNEGPSSSDIEMGI